MFHPVPARLTLVDGSTQVVIRPERPGFDSPVLCREWSPGAPAPRESATDLIGQDGTDDATAFTGASTVTLDLVIRDAPTESAYQLLEKLATMTHPSRRPYLYAARGNGETWRIALRGNDFSITYDRLAGSRLAVQLVFTAPDGLWESPERDSTLLAAADRGVGLIFPFHFPMSFGTSGLTSPPATIVNGGSVPVAPVLRVFGPTTAPKVQLSSGERFWLPGLSIADGDYLEVDMGSGLVALNGEPDASRLFYVDWDNSSYWRVPVGTSLVTLQTTGGTGHLTALWRDRRLTV